MGRCACAGPLLRCVQERNVCKVGEGPEWTFNGLGREGLVPCPYSLPRRLFPFLSSFSLFASPFLSISEHLFLFVQYVSSFLTFYVFIYPFFVSPSFAMISLTSLCPLRFFPLFLFFALYVSYLTFFHPSLPPPFSYTCCLPHPFPSFFLSSQGRVKERSCEKER